MTLHEFWEIDEDGDGLQTWGMVDPVFDATEYQVAENVADVYSELEPPEPNIVGNSPDTPDREGTCEMEYKKELQLVSVTDMENYRRVQKALMRD